jgi:hypothetical protein
VDYPSTILWPTLRGRGAAEVWFLAWLIQSFTDKKENKISLVYSTIRKFRWELLQSIYEKGLPNIGGNGQIFRHI